MTNRQGNLDWRTRRAPVGEAAAGIEDRFRNLILTHNAEGHGGPGGPDAPDPSAFPRLDSTLLQSSHRRSSSAVEAPAYPRPSGPSSSAATALPGQPAPSSPKPAKRRPNQAQRRQMNAQLTLTPDPRPHGPSQAQPARPPPYYQRHKPAYSHPIPLAPDPPPPPPPPPAAPSRRTELDAARARDSWRGPWQPVSHSAQRSAAYSTLPGTESAANLAASFGRGHRYAAGNANQYFRPRISLDDLAKQVAYLDTLCLQTVTGAEIERDEIARKEAFRQRIEDISRQIVTRYEHDQQGDPSFPASSVQLQCFGSLASGFATKDSDMDLGLLSPYSRLQPDAPGSPIPRLLEKAFLEAGLGARLLSRTRVPIIKLCESPPEVLRQRLLDARSRWEAGQDDDKPDGPEDEPEHDGPARRQDDEHPEETPSTGADAASPGDFQVPCRQSGKPQHFQLQQKSKSSLASYCALANRILRRAGGRDVNVSNYRKFSDVDWEILNRVCQAFIGGLFDARLRERISRYPSISLGDKPHANYFRPLSGLMSQVEGEQILQAWDDWAERPLFEGSKPLCEKAVRDWETLQTKSTIGLDMIAYTKDLETAIDQIKRTPPIQLLLLEQGEQESPSQYHARVREIKTLVDFHQDLGPEIERVIIGRYIQGIQPGDVRDAVAAYFKAHLDQSELQAVACRHQSLSLARDLKRASLDMVFDEREAANISKYIESLRSPLLKSSRGYFVPLPFDSASAIAAIKKLKKTHGSLASQSHGKFRDPLEFPKEGLGAQCDINFSAHLALQNTALLRCYALTDARVKPMVLFVKHWAKARGINSGYRGTLSSYGYVLMVLHYLVHIAQPFVCPNLQRLPVTTWPGMPLAEVQAMTTCKGYDVRFWRNEHEILQLAMGNQLTQSTASLGDLLRGFFEYFAQSGAMSAVPKRGFDWGRDVLSLRTHGGLLSKQEKGWTGAKTVYADDGRPADAGQPGASGDNDQQSRAEQPGGKNQHVKEIRLRYLFAIEDPFELDHNVARTVTHNGIVSIRDEFRRAWRIIQASRGGNHPEELLADVREIQESSDDVSQLFEDIHGSSEASHA